MVRASFGIRNNPLPSTPEMRKGNSRSQQHASTLTRRGFAGEMATHRALPPSRRFDSHGLRQHVAAREEVRLARDAGGGPFQVLEQVCRGASERIHSRGRARVHTLGVRCTATYCRSTVGVFDLHHDSHDTIAAPAWLGKLGSEPAKTFGYTKLILL